MFCPVVDIDLISGMTLCQVVWPSWTPTDPNIPRLISGVESHDTERRRQIALKALSERLHKSTDAKPGGKGASAGAQVRIRDWYQQDN